MFHVLGWSAATGGSVTDQDTTPVTDAEFSQDGSSHFRFTEPYRMLMSYHSGPTMTRSRFTAPHLDQVTFFEPAFMARSANVQSPPRTNWYDRAPVRLPIQEGVRLNQTDGASETTNHCAIIVGDDWSRNLPPAPLYLVTRFTAALTIAANVWSASAALTFEQSLRGGIYAVLGCNLIAATGIAFRLIFPRNKLYYGRRLRPGFLCQQANGDQPDPYVQVNPYVLGEWGRFWTQEPPQIELLGITPGAVTGEGRMWLAWLGEDPSLLSQWTGGLMPVAQASQPGVLGGMGVQGMI